jgi:aminopeptidase N
MDDSRRKSRCSRRWVHITLIGGKKMTKEDDLMERVLMSVVGKRSLSQFLLILLLILPNIRSALAQPEEGLMDYSIDVTFDIQASRIKGVATVPVKKGQEINFDKGALNLLYVILDKEYLDISEQKGILKILSSHEGTLEIGYEGIFKEPSSGFQGEQPSSVIGNRGIFLTGTWYPKPRQMCHYHLTAALPDGYEAVSEAETIKKTVNDGKSFFAFDFPRPLNSINFIANNRYKIVEDRFGRVEIFAYFFPEDLDLVKTYTEHAKHYLELYDHLISTFPYKRFSIVENFLPTGYSMPTYTLLGQEVVRLPFIPETSLGHEILHQWFGNLVYIDYAKGNWAEGLTTFLADLLYQEEKGRGVEYRKEALINYQSYVNEKNEFPLRDFSGRTGYASEAIGYGKALMVFQMLKNRVGEKRFYESIRYFVEENRFKKASWEDIRRAFEKFYPENLGWFFGQWIDGRGLPDLRLEEVKVEPSGAEFEVAFTVVQKGEALMLDLPVAIYSYLGKAKDVLHLQAEKERFHLVVADVPSRIALDEAYDVARMLSINEFPPVIARLIGDEKRVIVLPPSRAEIYEEVVEGWRGEGTSVNQPGQIKDIGPGTSSLLILGVDNPVVAGLYGSVVTRGGFSVLMKENPWNRRKVVGIFDARSKEEVKAAFQKIFHYGKYSAVSFDHGINVYKEIDQSAHGITEELLKEPVAIEISTLKTFSNILAHVAGKKIIYVGETHNLFSDHVMELEIIKDVHKRGKPIAIGMEMFQKPFQKVLDDYIGGKIDEAEFLRGTEYFKRWGFDYNLYRPILLYARLEKIPVIALNVPQEIVDQVFRSGLDSLSEEERKYVPSQMDFSDEAYKERLEKVFLEHQDVENLKTTNFDFFYQAQILWDETMAASVDQFLSNHPNDQMIVLSGSGHLAYGSGIPKRVARRNGYNYTIILNDADLEKGIADFVLFPEAIAGVTSPMLMVFLREEAGKVAIVGFPHNSVSEKAGMKVGDILLAIDHTRIRTIDDVKIDLLARNKGDKVKVKVSRKGLLGSQEMDFDVTLR